MEERPSVLPSTHPFVNPRTPRVTVYPRFRLFGGTLPTKTREMLAIVRGQVTTARATFFSRSIRRDAIFAYTGNLQSHKSAALSSAVAVTPSILRERSEPYLYRASYPPLRCSFFLPVLQKYLCRR